MDQTNTCCEGPSPTLLACVAGGTQPPDFFSALTPADTRGPFHRSPLLPERLSFRRWTGPVWVMNSGRQADARRRSPPPCHHRHDFEDPSAIRAGCSNAGRDHEMRGTCRWRGRSHRAARIESSTPARRFQIFAVRHRCSQACCGSSAVVELFLREPNGRGELPPVMTRHRSDRCPLSSRWQRASRALLFGVFFRPGGVRCQFNSVSMAGARVNWATGRTERCGR